MNKKETITAQGKDIILPSCRPESSSGSNSADMSISICNADLILKCHCVLNLFQDHPQQDKWTKADIDAVAIMHPTLQ